MDKKIINFSDTEIEKHKFHQHKRPISINNIDINTTVVPNKVLNISLVIKMVKKLDLYVYYFQ